MRRWIQTETNYNLDELKGLLYWRSTRSSVHPLWSEPFSSPSDSKTTTVHCFVFTFGTTNRAGKTNRSISVSSSKKIISTFYFIHQGGSWSFLSERRIVWVFLRVYLDGDSCLKPVEHVTIDEWRVVLVTSQRQSNISLSVFCPIEPLAPKGRFYLDRSTDWICLLPSIMSTCCTGIVVVRLDLGRTFPSLPSQSQIKDRQTQRSTTRPLFRNYLRNT